jgi:uncharacterized protein YndB with AHSA1/START domain
LLLKFDILRVSHILFLTLIRVHFQSLQRISDSSFRNVLNSKQSKSIAMKVKTAYIAITVSTIIDSPVQKVWEYWTNPNHIIHWNNASSDWHTPRAENDLRAGGKFLSRMEACDGSMGFDFEGEYLNVEPLKLIEYVLADDRKIKVYFEPDGDKTKITEVFDAETENPVKMQQAGWQAILDNFKKYVEASEKEKYHQRDVKTDINF